MYGSEIPHESLQPTLILLRYSYACARFSSLFSSTANAVISSASQTSLLGRSGYRDVVWAKNGVEALDAFTLRASELAMSTSVGAAAASLCTSSSSSNVALESVAIDMGSGTRAAMGNAQVATQYSSPFSVVLSE